LIQFSVDDNFLLNFSYSRASDPAKEGKICCPQISTMDQQTVTIQDGTELITLGTQLNPNVHFIKTDAVLGSAAIILHSQGTGSSGQQQIQYTLQPDMLVGTSSEGQPTPGAIYFTGNPYAIDQSASQAAQILSAFKFEDLYHNPPQQAKLVPSSGINLYKDDQ
jgi:hypothetical protein